MAAFGNARWLDIAVRPSGSGAFTVLGPRQPITAAPYAIFAANSANGGGNSPWLLNGSTTFYNAGNVGIGTMNPSGRLHVDSGSALGFVRVSGRSPIFAAGAGVANAELIIRESSR